MTLDSLCNTLQCFFEWIPSTNLALLFMNADLGKVWRKLGHPYHGQHAPAPPARFPRTSPPSWRIRPQGPCWPRESQPVMNADKVWARALCRALQETREERRPPRLTCNAIVPLLDIIIIIIVVVVLYSLLIFHCQEFPLQNCLILQLLSHPPFSLNELWLLNWSGGCGKYTANITLRNNRKYKKEHFIKLVTLHFVTGAVHIHYLCNKQSSPEMLLMALYCVLLLFTGNS